MQARHFGLRCRLLWWGCLGLGVVGMLAGCRPVQRMLDVPAAPVTVTLAKPDDRTVVSLEENQTVVELFSTSGIGGADLAWAADQAPPALVLRLHTKGLEGLSVAAGDITVNASVSSSPPHTVSAATPEEELTPASPTWIDIKLVADQAAGEATIPLSNGYFEVVIPPALLAAGQGQLGVTWIDFYR